MKLIYVSDRKSFVADLLDGSFSHIKPLVLASHERPTAIVMIFGYDFTYFGFNFPMEF